MNIALTTPPTFDFASLEPVLSRDAIRDHLVQYHASACADAVTCIKGTVLEPLSIDSLIQLTPHLSRHERLFRLACQIRNHNFYWQSLHPGGGITPWGPVGEAIRDRFGTLRNFSERVQQQAAMLLGPGWLWLVWHKGWIQIRTTEGDSTLPPGAGTVLLALDLWEHAYYADFRSRRGDYIAACLNKLCNWDFANRRLRTALLHRKRVRQDMADAAARLSSINSLRPCSG
jgi:superoxide dismutase, Fe-Mn family